MCLYFSITNVCSRIFILICLFCLVFTTTATAKKKSAPLAPVITYHFKVHGELSGGEQLWVNEVYLGKLPLTITRDEFMKKVPLLKDPPAGYVKDKKWLLNEHWFKILITDYKLRTGSSIDYEKTNKLYFARIKLNDEWGEVQETVSGHAEQKRMLWDTTYSINNAEFKSRQKIIAEKAERLQILLRVARANDYKVGDEWYKALETHGKDIWRDFRIQDQFGVNGYKQILDGWACWKFGIDDPNDKKSARRGFEEICKYVDSRKGYDSQAIEGWAVKLIYDKLDLDELMKKCKKILSSKKGILPGLGGAIIHRKEYWIRSWNDRKNVSDASATAVMHALILCDEKFDTEDFDGANPVELQIVPMLMRESLHPKGAGLNTAAKIGGPVIIKFLLRNNWKTTDRADRKNVFHLMDHYGGLDGNINCWLYFLIHMDDPAALKFRRQNSEYIIKLADRCINPQFMDSSSQEPPGYLVSDAKLGKKSLAWQYRDKYIAKMKTVNITFIQTDRIFRYLAALGDLATVDMFLDAWHDIHRTITDYDIYMSVDKAFRALPGHMCKEFGERLINFYQKKLKALDTRNNKNLHEYDNYTSAITRIKRNMVILAGGKHIEYHIESNRLESRGSSWRDEAKDMKRWQGNKPEYVDYFSKHKSSNVRLLALVGIEYFPTAENRKTLQLLLDDPDEKVKAAAEKTAAEIERIKKLPLESLVAYPAAGKEKK